MLAFAAIKAGVYSLERLFSHHTHAVPKPLESTLLVAATALTNHHVFSFIGSHWKTPPCRLILFLRYSIAEQENITSSLLCGMLTARHEITQ